ncbi:catalase [Pseudomonas sp. CCI3.2]|uniref:catalase n=1 Tax=unclassified Pseudomonas TaxID=196821 RepID=UPI002AC99BDB|nr:MULTISPECIES: catalase [unclassified Pseudomonas]MEB0075968.1 catalase [Pseudomonas sp. MH10out]MEB0101413.1 catalase [Pseudomonas sp. CCI3.2]MEB0130947.1 catalase [Pseudomonas sp. CCI2.4]MEB0157925.1 catalase [Pseudomonas sp. AH2 (2023)]MEB0166370.1 catalase [Pseudomonas sp. CCC4.4]
MSTKTIILRLTVLATLVSGQAFAAQTEQLTRDSGAPIGDNENSQTAGPAGPVLLQDASLIEKLQRFDRERIPERVVHARGTGAFGEFVPSADIHDLTVADVFKPGSKTPVFVRFSTVMGYRGSPEQARDPRGFAVKFYTDQGNWDMVGINWPIFFIRDAIKFPDFVHANKPSAVTGVQDPDLAFDFFAHTPEATHMLTRLYTVEGMPDSYRHMNGSAVHAFKFVNAEGLVHYVKFAWRSQQGVHGLKPDDIAKSLGNDWNMMSNDLYGAINKGDFPKWDLYVQVLTPGELGKFNYDALDDTKVWTGVPEKKVGTMTLNRMPDNYFESVEESAFAPSRLVPGIEASEDRMLQGRLFAYADTQMYRLGANYQQLPINRPLTPVVNNSQDGAMNASGRKGNINFEPSGVHELAQDPKYKYAATPVSGVTQQMAIHKPNNFAQAGEYYRGLSDADKGYLVEALGGDLSKVTNDSNKYAMLSYFYKADTDYGTRLAKATHSDVGRVKTAAALLQD